MQQNLEQIKQLIDVSIQKGVFANAESVLALSNAFNEIVKFIQEHGANNTNN
jgi:hypothetical protein